MGLMDLNYEDMDQVKRVTGVKGGLEVIEFVTGNVACGRYLVSRKTRSRNFEVWDFSGEELLLVCLCVYKKGALEVMRRLAVADRGGV